MDITSEKLIQQPIVWVDSNEKLEQVCEKWESTSLLAVDTEFMRSDTYYPIAGLIQVNDGECNYLIDPTSVDDYFPLVEIFDNEEITKVFHSCSEDLEVFQHTIGCTPKQLFDTQIAGALAGLGFSMGFANMVRSALGVDLPKTETRSNWLLRPLSQSQVFYAALDVEYLFLLAKHLTALLEKANRMEWAIEESNSLVKRYFDNQDPDKSFLRIKSAWKLKPRELALLQKLFVWRENLAQDSNQPRNRILKEHALFDIAKLQPKHIAQLRNVEGVADRMIKKNGTKIIDIVTDVKAMDESELPAALSQPLSSSAKEPLKLLKAFVLQKGSDLNIPPEILVRKKDYEYLVRGLLENKANLKLSPGLHGWREDPIGMPLLEYAKSLNV